MAKRTLQQLLEEKQKHEEKGKIIAEKIKAYKRQQGERIAIIAADIGLTDMDISDEEWKTVFHEIKGRFQQSRSEQSWKTVKEIPPS